MLNPLRRLWHLASATAPADHPRHRRAAAASPARGDDPQPTDSPQRPGADRPARPAQVASTASPLHQRLSLAAIQREREALESRLAQCETQLRGLEADQQGIVARYAQARLQGLPQQRRLIERVHGRLKVKMVLLQQWHADQLAYLGLLDTLHAKLEDAQARQGVAEQAFQGMGLADIEALLAQDIAQRTQSKLQLQHLQDAINVQAEDEDMQRLHAEQPLADELMRLSEALVQQGADAALQPLEDLADALDAGHGALDSNPSAAAAARRANHVPEASA